MPKQEKKTRQEMTAEEYFPIEKSDLKQTTEKQEKEPISRKELLKGSIEKEYKEEEKEVESVEKSVRKKPKRKSRKKSRVVKYNPVKLNLKQGGYELIITEKPQAAIKIATALGDATQKTNNKISYYELERDGRKIVVACAVGHLFTLKQNKAGYKVPIFDIKWYPNYLVRKNDFTKRYYDTLLKLAKNAGSLTVATDFDVEGEVIGLNVVRFICGQKDASRMKFSTLTPNELNKAYEEKFPTINWGQAIAGETRHYLDWFYGINLSRALMNSIKTTGKFQIMSIGRVQGPALNLIVEKEKEIQAFKPELFHQVFITIDDSKNKLELKHNKDIFSPKGVSNGVEKDLKKFDGLVGKTAIAQTKKTQQILPPNPPFNLTTLQTEAYKFYGITPSRTLQIAQSLYLSGLISYPRTSSQQLPESIEYKKILKQLAKKYKVEKLITREKPIQGKKTDPAHPSIYPTGNSQILSGQDEKIYELIVKRFLSLFCDDAIINNKTIRAEINDLVFSTRGSEIEKKSWMEIYPLKLKEKQIPDVEGEVKIIDLKKEQKQTQPPKRYSPASIVSELEKQNLGTKATRASILETLYDRNYIKEKSIQATPLGMSLIATLKKYSPIIIDQKLTRYFEKEIEDILDEKGDYRKKENKIIEEAKKTITKIGKDFEENKEKIGKELLQANLDLRAQQKIENTLNKCPKCGKGNLAITYSRKTRRHFVACNAYPDCKTTYSLPPNSTIKKTDKICEHCGFPILMSLKARKKPWFFCFNTECESNKERIEEYRKKKEEEENKA